MRANRVLIVAKDEAQAQAAIADMKLGDKFDMHAVSWVDAPGKAVSCAFQLVIVMMGADTGIAAATGFARAAARWDQRQTMMLVAFADAASARMHRELQSAGFDDIVHQSIHRAQILSRLSVMLRLSTMRRELDRRQLSARDFTNGERLFLAPSEPAAGAGRASVLLVRFDPGSAGNEQFTRAVRSSTDAQVAEDVETAQSMLYRGGLEGVLLCSGDSDEPAIEFASMMRTVPALHNLPVLLATPQVRALDLDEVFDAGITDVAAIDLPSEQLAVHLAAFKRLEALRTALAPRFDKNVETVIRDGVTGMACHGFGLAHLERTLVQARALNLPVSVARLQLRNLKMINAAHGYRAGDMALRKIGNTIRRCIRGEDMATRLSGTQFLVQFPDTDYLAARVAIQRLYSVLRFLKIDLPDGGGAVSAKIDYNLAGWDGQVDVEALIDHLGTKNVAVAA